MNRDRRGWTRMEGGWNYRRIWETDPRALSDGLGLVGNGPRNVEYTTDTIWTNGIGAERQLFSYLSIQAKGDSQ